MIRLCGLFEQSNIMMASFKLYILRQIFPESDWLFTVAVEYDCNIFDYFHIFLSFIYIDINIYSYIHIYVQYVLYDGYIDNHYFDIGTPNICAIYNCFEVITYLIIIIIFIPHSYHHSIRYISTLDTKSYGICGHIESDMYI